MGGKYYQVRRKDNTEANGIVLRVCEDNLETFAGCPEPKTYGCSIDKEGNLLVGEDYFPEEITFKEALKLRESYENWILLQGWVATDPHPDSVLSNTPGTRHYFGGS